MHRVFQHFDSCQKCILVSWSSVSRRLWSAEETATKYNINFRLVVYFNLSQRLKDWEHTILLFS